MDNPPPEFDAPAAFRDLCTFDVSLRFEIFYALEAVTNPESDVQRAWCAEAKADLPDAFWRAYETLGHTPLVWALGPDLFAPGAALATFDELVDAIAAAPATVLRDRFLFGILHEAPVVETLLASGDIPRALAMCSIKKREWYVHVGLFPYRPDAPLIEAIRRVAEDPEAFRVQLLVALNTFWTHAFAALWRNLEPNLRRSAGDKGRLFAALSFQEFARASLLRVELDERKSTLRAIRGGYEVPLARVSACHFTPSLFNEARLWSAYKGDDGQAIVHFPYFDPALTFDAPSPRSLGPRPAPTTAPHGRPAMTPVFVETPPPPPAAAPTPASSINPVIDPAIDPATVFRALGHVMRYAIVTLLAESPRTSAELAEVLAISKANMSHHLKDLRDAGLIDEKKLSGRRIELSLRREIIADLSAATLAQLFPTDPRVPEV